MHSLIIILAMSIMVHRIFENYGRDGTTHVVTYTLKTRTISSNKVVFSWKSSEKRRSVGSFLK